MHVFLNMLEKPPLIVKIATVKHATILLTMSTKHENASVLETERGKVKPPPLYKVILLNDDYTTMEFVIEVLERFFAMNRERATQIMLQVHNEGSAVCGVYTRDIAETKVMQVAEYARQHEHPLRCKMEEN